MTDDLPFWKAKTMQEMTRNEWESLCDGCAKCCLVKLEDEDSGALAFTDIACDLLDCETCGCGDYANRSVRVPDCVTLTPKNVDQLYWMPATCAYKLIAEGEDLPWWHPLVSGEQESVHQAGISARGRVVHESTIPVEEWESRIVHWPAVGFEGLYEPGEHINPDADEKND
ncbi:MAG: YcgN family cysteine cluster protein [Parvibaculaceae bacterium]|nr:YcgN family cysteine cluster protein [Parvibaculaceae bacterium]